MTLASTAFPRLSSTTPKQITDTNSPFRYPGGKSYARKLILEHLCPHDFYCEPFAGGASVFFSKEKVGSNWLNDKDVDLVTCMTVIRDRVEELIAALDAIPPAKALHRYYKHEFPVTDDLTRAVRWYYLNRVSYSGIMKMENCYWGYDEKHSMRPENWPRHLRKCSEKLQGVKLTCDDFENVIAGCPDGAFLFVDPPYFDADQDKFYTCSFKTADHYRLRDCLYANRGRVRFLLTYDNSPGIVGLYEWAKLAEKEWNYNIQRTDDQKAGKKSADGHKGSRGKGKELFLFNYEPRMWRP